MIAVSFVFSKLAHTSCRVEVVFSNRARERRGMILCLDATLHSHRLQKQRGFYLHSHSLTREPSTFFTYPRNLFKCCCALRIQNCLKHSHPLHSGFSLHASQSISVSMECKHRLQTGGFVHLCALLDTITQSQRCVCAYLCWTKIKECNGSCFTLVWNRMDVNGWANCPIWEDTRNAGVS